MSALVTQIYVVEAAVKTKKVVIGVYVSVDSNFLQTKLPVLVSE